ncbi:2-deoxyglucose-6-phosphate phosphatase [compost metagenome]
MLKAFIFDMDGVIIDSEPLHYEVDIETMNYFGHVIVGEQLDKYVGMTNPEMWKLIREEFQVIQSVEEIIEYQLARKISSLRSLAIEPIEGIRELILNIKSRNWLVGIASSSPRVFIEEVVSKFGIAEYFDCIVSGEEVPHGKPAPDVYLEAALQLGVEPQECLVLEDSRNGIVAAKAAGMGCIGYVNLNSGNQDLSQADSIVKKIADINLEDWN